MLSIKKVSINSEGENSLLDGHCLENLCSASGGGASQVTGILLAEYTYSAYGDVLMKSEELAQKYTIKFSTKYAENTSLYRYSYRDYSPKLRKWTSHEPFGEEATRNLNLFCQNNPIIDILGSLCISEGGTCSE